MAQGAFYPHQFRVLVGLVAVSLFSSTVVRSGAWTTVVHPFTAMLSALAVVAVLSGWMGHSLSEALPTIGLLGVLGGAFVVVRRAGPAERDAVVAAVIVIGVLTALSGIVAVMLRRQPLSLVDEGLWRAASTLTYSNATAGFLLVPTMLALGRTVGRRRSVVWPLAASVLVVAIVTTLSRGGAFALAVGVGVLMAVAGFRVVAARTWHVHVGAAIALAGILPIMPDRLPARPMLAVATLAAGAAVVVLAHHGRRLAVAAAVTGVGAAVLLGASQLDLQRDITSVRGTAASPARLDGWGSAIDIFTRDPVFGAGPGNATFAYVTDQGESLVTMFVHNEYLQVLAEMGALGILVLAVGFGVTAWRLRRPPPDADPGTWIGGVAGLAALCVHSGLDFLWHVPAVPLTAAIVLGVVSDRGVRVGDVDAVRAERQPIPS